MSVEHDLDAWQAWTPDELHARIGELDVTWAVAAGWALDLFVGGEPRQHEDLEIAVARSTFPVVRAALPELEWFGSGGIDGVEETIWPIDEAPAELHQTWGWDPVADRWRIDVFREPWEGETWVCRRDTTIRMPVTAAIERTRGGIPYLAPEIVLLFKARHTRDKDEADFERALPLLTPDRRTWLAASLRLVHPGHAWIDVVEA